MIGRIHRVSRVEPRQDGGQIRGIAATWQHIEADPWRLRKGCFDEAVNRVRDGIPVPLMIEHGSGLAVGRVGVLEQADDGLRFAADPYESQRTLLDENIAGGTANDVSVDVEIVRVDPVNERDVIEAKLREISICRTGFGADPGAGLGRMSRLGMSDAAYMLELIQSIDTRLGRLFEVVNQSPENDWGKPVSDELRSAIDAELAALDASTREAFASLFSKTEGE